MQQQLWRLVRQPLPLLHRPRPVQRRLRRQIPRARRTLVWRRQTSTGQELAASRQKPDMGKVAKTNGKSEIRLEEDVLRADIAMNDALRVEIKQGARKLDYERLQI
jgi:hypothetical protein